MRPGVISSARRRSVSVPDAYVVALWHFDEANGSTTFADSSGHGHTIGATGNPVASNAQAKFGSTSLYINGTSSGGNNILTSDNSSDFSLDGDFTIEAWAYAVTKTNSNMYFLSRSGGDTTSGGFEMGIDTTDHWTVNTYDAGNILRQVVGPSYSTGSWVHMAVDRSGSTVRLYVNGSVQGSVTNAATLIGGRLEIGHGASGGGNGDWNGYLQDIRISKGIARYNGSNFTPPTAPYS